MVKKNKRFTALAALALAAILALAGCGAPGSASSQAAVAATPPADNWSDDAYKMYESSPAGVPGESATGAGGTGGVTVEPPQDGRKIIMTAQVQMETQDFVQTCADLQAACRQAGGQTYATSISNQETKGARYASFTFKIPPERYADFLKALDGYGNVLTRNEQSEDVTGQYVDIEANLQALETERDRLLEMMEAARNLEELLLLQDRLTQLQIDINYYTQSRRQLDRLTSFCTVDISVREVVLYTEPKEEEDSGFGARMERAFSETWRNFGIFFQELWLVIVWMTPLLIVAAVVTAIVITAVKLHRRHRKLHPKPEAPRPQPAPAGPYAPYPPYPPYPAPRLGPGGNSAPNPLAKAQDKNAPAKTNEGEAAE